MGIKDHGFRNGCEVMHMLHAWECGICGFATLYADSFQHVRPRLLEMASTAKKRPPILYVNKLIDDVVNIVVFVDRSPNGDRTVVIERFVC